MEQAMMQQQEDRARAEMSARKINALFARGGMTPEQQEEALLRISINFWQRQNAINALRGAGNRPSGSGGTASWNTGYRSPWASYGGEDG